MGTFEVLEDQINLDAEPSPDVIQKHGWITPSPTNRLVVRTVVPDPRKLCAYLDPT